MSLISEAEKAGSPMWALNPQSRRFVLRDGPTYARLVKMGIVEDEGLRLQWEEKREADRARRIAAAAEARVIGVGPAGGVMGRTEGVAARPAAVPRAAPRAAPRVAPQPPRGDVRALVLEHREALCRPGLTKEGARNLLRKAWAESRASTAASTD